MKRKRRRPRNRNRGPWESEKQVKCPVCGVEAGVICTSRTKYNAREPHVKRADAFRVLQAKRQPVDPMAGRCKLCDYAHPVGKACVVFSGQSTAACAMRESIWI